MALDGKILRRARDRLERMKAERAARTQRRLEEVYQRAPQLRAVDARIRETMLDAMQLVLSGAAEDDARVEELRMENSQLQLQRAETLGRLGLPADYTDEGYMCPKCRDTGYCGAGLCSCLKALYAQEQKEELSGLLKLGEQTFDAFDLDWYDDTPDPSTGISPRQSMEFVYETCVAYARRFGARSRNLLFTGGTGLGKTFLSACIARVVAEKGCSVVYETAAELFARFEAEKFARGDAADSSGDVRRYLNCDLLILDDLGTEMTTVFVTSALDTLVNTRLAAGKKTIISTNLTEADIAARYSPQIASRVQGEYQALRFYGQDIRLLKKARGQ